MHLKAVNLAKSESSFTLGPLSLSFECGLSVITGKSGSGKTTLLTLLSGLVHPDSGEVLLDGIPVNKSDKTISMVFQHPERQLFANTVFEDVSYALKRSRIDEKTVSARSAEVLEMMGIGQELWRVSPFSLSGGEKRRGAIASCIVTEPSVLLLDEPYSGLDSYSLRRVEEALRYISRKSIVIVVSHDEGMIPDNAFVAVIDGGHVHCSGSRLECGIYRDYERFAMHLGLDLPASEDSLEEMLRGRIK